MEKLVDKPDKILVPEIGWVTDGEIVEIPEHNIVLVEGDDIGIKCPQHKGRVSFIGGIPHYVAIVECGNANRLGVEIQCTKRWKSKGN